MIKVIILGIIQGLTEFLPISSSGHLAVMEKFLGIKEPVAFAAFLHFGTLLATIVFFIKPILIILKGLFKGESRYIKYLAYIVIGNIPIVIFALVFKSLIEQSFKDMKFIAISLGITGAILLLTAVIRKGEKKVNLLEALLIGIGQMFAVFPGLSRSGLTISAGLFTKVEPQEAFQFSFLLSLPAVLGANLLELNEITNFGDSKSLLLGMCFSFIAGLVALRLLRDLVQRKFYLFGFYCLLVSLIFLFLI